MTLVGKILTIVIMAFSLLLLGFSTVVFTTSKNWKEATDKEKAQVQKLQTALATAKANVDAAKKEQAATADEAVAKVKLLEERIAKLQADNDRSLAAITDYRGQLAKANATAQTSLAEVEAKRIETFGLREQKSAVEKQANEFKLKQAELNDKIRELERQLETATKNNRDLRETVAKFSTLLRQNGLSDDIAQIKGIESPPPVTGEIKQVDPTNRRVVLTIGSDDGLVVNHELFMYRTKPIPEYLGRLQIIAVDPDQAVAKVIGNTFQGKKLKEGDIVSSSIKPRF
jgi:multidrug efflux pump subunit AcrA (membrane-fusion protein)